MFIKQGNKTVNLENVFDIIIKLEDGKYLLVFYSNFSSGEIQERVVFNFDTYKDAEKCMVKITSRYNQTYFQNIEEEEK